jgi:Saxitoxin biosynthesis operon protein SxtJ
MSRDRQAAFHENLQEEPLNGPSERTFGVVMATFFALLGLFPLIHHRSIRGWALGLSGLFLVTAVAFPSILKPLNLIWAKLGLLLSRISNPVVTGLMFYLFFTPAALVLKAMGKDPLRMKFDANAKTYWIMRVPPGPEPESMRRQF